MNFVQFLARKGDESSSQVIQFKGREYPLLFFSAFLKLHKVRGISIESIDLDRYDFFSLVARLESTFLGNSSLYWIGNVDQLESKKKNEFFDYVQHYRGPNKIWFYSDSDAPDLSIGVTIELPGTVDKQTWQALAQFFYENDNCARVSRFYTQFPAVDTISLDQAYMLMHYGLLLAQDQPRFIKEWLPQLIRSEKSLFTLSQYFFAKQEKKFFPCWTHIQNDYSEQFWIVFWSEQLFRALHVIAYLKSKKFTEAKAIAYRLPFSFMQQDWKKNSVAELNYGHRFLYELDYILKNGGNTYGLDLFFSKFFLGEFQKNNDQIQL